MVLPCLIVMAETVLQVIPLVLLCIEPLILYCPPSPACLRQFFHRPLCHWQVRQEIKHCLLFPAFPSFYEIYMVPAIFYPIYMVMPDFFLFPVFFAIPLLLWYPVFFFLVIALQLP